MRWGSRRARIAGLSVIGLITAGQIVLFAVGQLRLLSLALIVVGVWLLPAAVPLAKAPQIALNLTGLALVAAGCLLNEPLEFVYLFWATYMPLYVFMFLAQDPEQRRKPSISRNPDDYY